MGVPYRPSNWDLCSVSSPVEKGQQRDSVANVSCESWELAEVYVSGDVAKLEDVSLLSETKSENGQVVPETGEHSVPCPSPALLLEVPPYTLATSLSFPQNSMVP